LIGRFREVRDERDGSGLRVVCVSDVRRVRRQVGRPTDREEAPHASPDLAQARVKHAGLAGERDTPASTLPVGDTLEDQVLTAKADLRGLTL
jgi:hypothetical protein